MHRPINVFISWQEPDWEDEDVVLKPGTKDDTDGSPAWIIIVVVLGGFALLCAFLFYDYWQKAGNPLANRPVRKIGAYTQHVANYLGFMCDSCMGAVHACGMCTRHALFLKTLDVVVPFQGPRSRSAKG